MKQNRIAMLLERMEDALSQLHAKQDRVTEIERELEALCPAQIGSVVTVDDDEPNAGKSMEVAHIAFSIGGRYHQPSVRYRWVLTGPVLRKDKSKSLRHGTHSIEIQR